MLEQILNSFSSQQAPLDRLAYSPEMTENDHMDSVVLESVTQSNPAEDLARYLDGIEHAPVGLLGLSSGADGQPDLSFANAQARNLLGLQLCSSRQIWVAFLELMSPNGRAEFLQLLNEARKPPITLEVKVRALVHGSQRFLRLRFLSALGSDGQPEVSEPVSSFNRLRVISVEDITVCEADSVRCTDLLAFARTLKESINSIDEYLGTDKPTSPPYHDKLSEREREVCALLQTGISVDQLSRWLCISESTTKKHISTIYHKLGVASRAEFMCLNHGGHTRG
ncbi:MAG: hypothetical protein A2087_08495 [Spirochaetes bacterium GWD1_61_31]|nr:MAG: hypothetical protein A2Y37_13320 [Spirochaetes bacterium GWB1_60_80]OHD32209.1 MAG: hypothetical protein A2004_10975 [Spirochaetes bacterium GWC1_61_12]OHD36712.1 MAG: hypothetical protein A2087_08495 [Spirochaetes bacterium GWD1_61_31]OHD42530.1 MAG: hypothetical protein A2Y35_08115 [Spirochaetes bacterium GWE1_60_18]OHD57894.1 MAG: hypothetical protein A2Y32_05185 [Spirochaetes bacterium GWF1_60_12]